MTAKKPVKIKKASREKDSKPVKPKKAQSSSAKTPPKTLTDTTKAQDFSLFEPVDPHKQKPHIHEYRQRIRQRKSSANLVWFSSILVVIFFLVSIFWINDMFSDSIKKKQFENQQSSLDKEFNQKFTQVSLFTLPIYPDYWVQQNFNQFEIANPLLSGPEGDFDKDGLINKYEFIYFSDPKKANTLCDSDKSQYKYKCNQDLKDLNDKQKLDQSIHPATGAKILNDYTYVLKKEQLDPDYLTRVFKFAKAEDLYFTQSEHQSSSVNYSPQIEGLSLNQNSSFTASGIDKYYSQIKDILHEFLVMDNFSTFLSVYESNQIEDLNLKKDEVDLALQQIVDLESPSQAKYFQQACIFWLQSLKQSLQNRINIQDINSKLEASEDQAQKDLMQSQLKTLKQENQATFVKVFYANKEVFKFVNS